MIGEKSEQGSRIGRCGGLTSFLRRMDKTKVLSISVRQVLSGIYCSILKVLIFLSAA